MLNAVSLGSSQLPWEVEFGYLPCPKAAQMSSQAMTEKDVDVLVSPFPWGMQGLRHCHYQLRFQGPWFGQLGLGFVDVPSPGTTCGLQVSVGLGGAGAAAGSAAAASWAMFPLPASRQEITPSAGTGP